MAENKIKSDNCFNEFDDISPKRKEPSIQVLYDYEKHYMELVRKYSSEITMIADMLEKLRKEQVQFYNETLPQITAKLNNEEAIDDEMKKVWLNRLTTNVNRSFGLSETLINDFVTKSIDEFKAAVNEKLQKL